MYSQTVILCCPPFTLDLVSACTTSLHRTYFQCLWWPHCEEEEQNPHITWSWSVSESQYIDCIAVSDYVVLKLKLKLKNKYFNTEHRNYLKSAGHWAAHNWSLAFALIRRSQYTTVGQTVRATVAQCEHYVRELYGSFVQQSAVAFTPSNCCTDSWTNCHT